METDSKYVIFKLEKEHYGLPIEKVIGIEKMHNPTRVPNVPKYVKGVINLRGEVIPLIDLREKLKLDLREKDNDSRIVIVSHDEIIAGLIVDSSSEVMEISKEYIDSAPSTRDNERVSYISGIGKMENRLIILLELSKILEY